MERASASSLSSSPRSADQGLSCWGRFKLKLPWKRGLKAIVLGSRIRGSTSIHQQSFDCNACLGLTSKRTKPIGGFKYDPLSYAQNFDEGEWDDGNEDLWVHGFTSRYATPSSNSHGEK